MRRIPMSLVLAMLCVAQSPTRSGIDRSSLDPTCKPCEDFYRYATGGWTDKKPIPADRPSWGSLARGESGAREDHPGRVL